MILFMSLSQNLHFFTPFQLQRTVLRLCVVAISFAPLCAKAFHGPFAGIQLGYAMNKITLSHTLGTLNGSTSPEMSNWILGVHGGYGRTFENKFYLGTELFITHDGNGDATKDYTLTRGSTRTAVHTKVYRSFSFGMDVRAGMQFEAAKTDMVIYIGPTLQFSRWIARGTAIGDGSQTTTKAASVGAFGGNLGWEGRIKRDLSVGVVAKYLTFGKLTFSNLKVDASSYQVAAYVNLHM